MSPKFVSLKDIAEVTSGGGAPQSDNDFGKEGTPFIRAGTLPKLLNGQSELEQEKISDQVAKNYKLKKFSKNTILFAKSGMSATKGHIYLTVGECYIVNHLAALVCNEKANPAYIAYALKKYSPTTLILDPAYPSIRLSDIANLKIPLPPLAEQQRIAALLDTADNILKQRESAIAKLDQLAQSVFVDMLGDLNINSKNISLVKLKNICTYSQGLQVDVSKQYENKLTENDVRFLRIIDFTQGNQQPRYIENPGNKYYLHENEIAMVRYGATGFVCNGLNGVIANNLFKISIKDENFHPKYMLMYFKSDYFQRKLKSLNVGVAMPAINFRTLDVFEVPFVSYDNQMKLADIHTTISENILFHKKNLEKLLSLFRSLQHQSFAVN